MSSVESWLNWLKLDRFGWELVGLIVVECVTPTNCKISKFWDRSIHRQTIRQGWMIISRVRVTQVVLPKGLLCLRSFSKNPSKTV